MISPGQALLEIRRTALGVADRLVWVALYTKYRNAPELMKQAIVDYHQHFGNAP